MFTFLILPIIMISIIFYIIMAVGMTIITVTANVVSVTTASIFGSLLSNISSALVFPKYLKRALALIKDDRETFNKIKTIYLKHYQPIARFELFKALLMLFLLIFAFSLFFNKNDNGIGAGMFLIFILGIYSFVDLFNKRKNSLGFLDNNRKKLFLNFIYDVYNINIEYAEYIYDEFKKQYKGTFISNIFKEFSGKNDYYNKFYEKNIFPSEEKEQIDMIFTTLFNDFKKGIELLKKAKQKQLSIIS